MDLIKSRNIYYICHTYDSFQKDQIDTLSPYFHHATVFIRAGSLIDLAGGLFPEKYGKYTSKAKINWTSKPNNSEVFLTPVRYFPIDFDYLHMGERHFHSVIKAVQKQKISPPDIIHSHFLWSAGYVGMRLKEKYEAPFIVTGHGYDVYDLPFKSKAWNKRICQVLNSADHIITVSNTNLACIQKLNIETPVSVIPNGFDASQFHPIDQIECREKLGLPVDKKILLTVGNCVAIKGQKYLIEAMKDIHTKYPDVICVIVGGGELYPNLQKLVVEMGLQNCVRLVGRRPHEEIPLWMNACDVFVLPSLNESFGVVIIEAMACGKPVVASNVGGVPEIICSETYGLLSQPGNAKDLSDKILLALERDWDTQGIREYAKKYTWDTVCKEILELYKSCM